MRKIIAVLVALTLIPASAGCSAVMPGASADVLRSPEPRETDVSLPSGDLENLVQGNGRFAFDLYRYLGTGDGNLFYSPHSISMALAMAYAGACAGTAEDMARALHFDLPPERLHATFNYLDMELASRGEGAEGKDDGGFRLNIVNAIWGQKGYPFLAEYLDVLARCYGAGLRVLDFVSAPDESRAVINDWVEEQTGDRIKELIPRGAVDELTRLVLTNAVYFNAAWASQFEEADTSDGTFFLLDGNEVTVPMMRQVSHFRYADYGMYEAVELPYDGHELSMLILVPKSGEFRNFEQTLGFELVAQAIAGLHGSQVALTMPRFSMETSFKLNGALSALGMAVAFDPAEADFSGMDGRRDLYISDVVHKAFVDVAEAGTEAAAATAVVIGATSVPSQPAQLTIDRPFVFLIRDMETGAILFLGRVMDPS